MLLTFFEQFTWQIKLGFFGNDIYKYLHDITTIQMALQRFMLFNVGSSTI